MQTVTFGAGETILREGEDGNTAFLITNGSVEITIGSGDKAKRIGSLETGDVFGEMSLLDPGPRSATVTALSDTDCVVTTYDEFIASIQHDPAQAVKFMQTLVRRLRYMNALMANMDPRKRRLSEVFRDWQQSIEQTEASMSEDDKRYYYASMYLGI